MATKLEWDELGEAIGRAGTVLRANATSSGLDAAVPTCPEWTVRGGFAAHVGKFAGRLGRAVPVAHRRRPAHRLGQAAGPRRRQRRIGDGRLGTLGEFRGVFRSDELCGISHGDLVDYKWEDYHGFNVLAEYVKIVADLKQRGF